MGVPSAGGNDTERNSSNEKTSPKKCERIVFADACKMYEEIYSSVFSHLKQASCSKSQPSFYKISSFNYRLYEILYQIVKITRIFVRCYRVWRILVNYNTVVFRHLQVGILEGCLPYSKLWSKSNIVCLINCWIFNEWI